MKTKLAHTVKTVETRKSQLQQVILPPHGHWLKVTAYLKKPEHTAIGAPLLNQLLGTTVARFGYFARYTAPRPRIEFQILTDRSMTTIKRIVLGYFMSVPNIPGTVRFTSVKFEKSNGSLPHALMFSIVSQLNNSPTVTSARQLMDVVHWGMNMAGFSYVQEAEAMAAHAAGCLHHVSGWQAGPVASLDNLAKRRA